jgi:hypothetical protein
LGSVFKITHVVLGGHVDAGDHAPTFLGHALEEFGALAKQAFLVEWVG